MQNDNFDQFSITRLWLLVRRELLMLTFWDYFIIFIMPFIFILFMLWLNLSLENNILKTAVSGDIFSPWYIFYILPAIILYVTNLGYFYSGFRQTDGLKISPNPFPRGMLPVRIAEKFIGEFICFAVLFPVTIQIILLLPFLIFRVDLSVWLNVIIMFFVFCSPLVAFIFLRIAIVENTSLRRYHNATSLMGIIDYIFLMASMTFFIFYGNVLPLHYIATAAAVITVILWWATYRIRSKNAKR